MTGPQTPQTFHWSECEETLAPLAAAQGFEFDPKARAFVAPGIRIEPPRVLGLPPGLSQGKDFGEESAPERAARLLRQREAGGHAPRQGGALAEYLAGRQDAPGRQCLVLMQAGTATLGYFDAGEALATKTCKRYVVRGNGRAQPAYLASKGKSRYGSRLRLQNARLLLEETAEKLREYWDEFGAPETLFVSAPAALWSELFLTKEPPPFSKATPTERIPLDLPVPNTGVLLRTYKALCYGRIVRDPLGS